MFKGSNVALITPFINNQLDEEAYVKLIHFHMKNGTNGLVPAGTTGESPTLSHDEHQKVIDLCIQESKGKIPVIAGTGSNSTEEAISLTKHAEKAGADLCGIFRQQSQGSLFPPIQADSRRYRFCRQFVAGFAILAPEKCRYHR